MGLEDECEGGDDKALGDSWQEAYLFNGVPGSHGGETPLTFADADIEIQVMMGDALTRQQHYLWLNTQFVKPNFQTTFDDIYTIVLPDEKPYDAITTKTALKVLNKMK